MTSSWPGRTSDSVWEPDSIGLVYAFSCRALQAPWIFSHSLHNDFFYLFVIIFDVEPLNGIWHLGRPQWWSVHARLDRLKYRCSRDRSTLYLRWSIPNLNRNKTSFVCTYTNYGKPIMATSIELNSQYLSTVSLIAADSGITMLVAEIHSHHFFWLTWLLGMHHLHSQTCDCSIIGLGLYLSGIDLPA